MTTETNELNIALERALTQDPPDFEQAKALLAQGADINGKGAHVFSLIQSCILSATDDPPECDDCERDSCTGCEKKKRQRLMDVVEFFIGNGWDTEAFALGAICYLAHSTHDRQMFYAVRRVLECPLSEDREAYESVLECIGTEESYQRCCEDCHEQENLYYAMYEMVEARMEGRDFRGIHPYTEAIGKRVDRVVYFADSVDFTETPRGTEYLLDFGFICGQDVVLIGPHVNVLLMNHLLGEEPQIDVSHVFGEGIVGSRITDITFEHKCVSKPNGCFGQPMVILHLDSGKSLRFTHDFGERDGVETRARFITESQQAVMRDRMDGLFALSVAAQIDPDKIDAYVRNTDMTPEEVTRTAIRLAEEYRFEVDSFKEEHKRAPAPEELVTSNWLELYEVLLRYGLDTAASFTENDRYYRNLLAQVSRLDNHAMTYKLLRLLFDHGADPNIIVKDEHLFEEIEDNVILNAELFEIEGEDRIPYEHDFRLWLLFMAHVGETAHRHIKLTWRDGYYVDMFRDCEAFTYRKENTEDGWDLHILIRKTGEEVAVL